MTLDKIASDPKQAQPDADAAPATGPDAFPRFRKEWNWPARPALVPGFAVPPQKGK